MKPSEEPKIGKNKEKAESFYKELIIFLLKKKQPFMVGGTYAFTQYTGIERPTKDIDIITTQDAYPNLLKRLNEGGYTPQLHEIELNWLAKVKKGNFFADIMFAERNGLHKVDKTWLEHAKEGKVLSEKVKLIPPEELLRSKIYIQGRHRNDSFDVIHLMLCQGKQMDWQLLLDRMSPHWELLAEHIFLFLFVYPSERRAIPDWVIKKIMDFINDRISHEPTKNKITRGLLLSPDYEISVSQFGFQPIRELK